MGIGTIDTDKPVIIVIGHNVPPAADIGDYLTENELEDKVELGGICCTSIDTTRVYTKAKIVSALGRQLRVLRAGIADVVVIDEQCIRADVLELCQRVQSPMIATNDKAMHGLVDRTDDDPDKIVDDLVSGRVPGVIILEPDQVGEVAVRTALQMDKKRRLLKFILSDEQYGNNHPTDDVRLFVHCDTAPLMHNYWHRKYKRLRGWIDKRTSRASLKLKIAIISQIIK